MKLILPSLLTLTLMAPSLMAGNAESGPCGFPYEDDEETKSLNSRPSTPTEETRVLTYSDELLQQMEVIMKPEESDHFYLAFEEAWRTKGVNGHKGSAEGSLAILGALKSPKCNLMIDKLMNSGDHHLAYHIVAWMKDNRIQHSYGSYASKGLCSEYLRDLKVQTIKQNYSNSKVKTTDESKEFISGFLKEVHTSSGFSTDLIPFFQAYGKHEAALAYQILYGLIHKVPGEREILQKMIETLGWSATQEIAITTQTVPQEDLVTLQLKDTESPGT